MLLSSCNFVNFDTSRTEREQERFLQFQTRMNPVFSLTGVLRRIRKIHHSRLKVTNVNESFSGLSTPINCFRRTLLTSIPRALQQNRSISIGVY